MKRLEQQSEQDPDGRTQSRRQRQAQVRAARERQQRIEQSLARTRSDPGRQAPGGRAGASTGQSDRSRSADHETSARGPAGQPTTCRSRPMPGQRIIVGVGVSQAATDTAELEPAVERIEANLEQKPQQMVVDGGFTHQGTVEAMEHRQIELIGSLTDRRTVTEAKLRNRGVAPEYFPSAFSYDAEHNHYPVRRERCCVTKVGRKTWQHPLPLPSRPRRLPGLPVASAVLSRQPQRPLAGAHRRRPGDGRLQGEDGRLRSRARDLQTASGRGRIPQRLDQRDKLGLRQFRLRGRVKVGLEALWVCLTYNIQQWIRLVWRPQRQAAPMAARAA